MKNNKFYVISVWDENSTNTWKFYSRSRRGKFHFSPDINEAEKYVKKGWADKCCKRLLESCNSLMLFNTINAEVITIHR